MFIVQIYFCLRADVSQQNRRRLHAGKIYFSIKMKIYKKKYNFFLKTLAVPSSIT